MSWQADRYQLRVPGGPYGIKPRRHRFVTRHHMHAKSLGGSNDPENLLRLWNDKHELFHMLFGLRSLEQAAELLLRIARAKKGSLPLRADQLLRSAEAGVGVPAQVLAPVQNRRELKRFRRTPPNHRIYALNEEDDLLQVAS